MVAGATYGLLRSLVAPDSPKNKSLEELTALLKDHFEPKPNTIAERFRFHRCSQHQGESVVEYVAELPMSGRPLCIRRVPRGGTARSYSLRIAERADAA